MSALISELEHHKSMMTMARRLALVFPGQGSQRVGMGADLLDLWPRVVGDTLDEASEAARLNLRRFMLDGPSDRLALTAVAQPALLAHSVAVLRVLQSEGGLEVKAPNVPLVLGHSLGEYSALVAAGAIAFADAVTLVHHRGSAMQEAVPAGQGAMAALMPVSAADAEEVCRLAADKTRLVCQVANYNSSKQIVVSGDRAAIEEAVSVAKRLKKVRRAVMLDVSAPFHCSLMAPAADALRLRLDELLDTGAIQPPQVPVVWNVEAEATDKSPVEIRDVLGEQVTSPVKWSQSVDFCVAQGVTDFLELGVGGVLTGLIKQHAPLGVTATSCGTGEQIRELLASW